MGYSNPPVSWRAFEARLTGRPGAEDAPVNGAPVFAEAAAELGLATVYGAELSGGLPGPQAGLADPEGDHLVLAGGLAGCPR